MSRILKLIPICLFCSLLLTACNSTADEKDLDRLNKSVMDSIGPQTLSSLAAVEDSKDTLHQFIRTADLKFRVPDVVTATYAIENITKQFNGFVTYTALTSTIDDKTTVAVSADSSLETSHFTVVNDIKLRVPNTLLDTTLKSIAALVDYLDYRVISADNAALQLLSTHLSQNRIFKNTQRLTAAIDNRVKN